MQSTFVDILNPTASNVDLFRIAATENKIRINRQAFDSDILLLALLLITVQVLDGFFTGIGVNIHGVAAEGNPLLRSLMHSVGPVPTLVAAKSITIILTIFLTIMTREIPWLKSALKWTLGFYLFAAIIPWSMIILEQY
jgi:hypothetical protein